MELVLSISKPVNDVEQGQQIFDTVKQKLSDWPDVRISGQVRDTLPIELNSEPE